MDTTTTKSGTVTTTDATVTDLFAIAMASDKTIAVTLDVVAKVATSAKHAAYKIHGVFYKNAGGNVTQVGDLVSLNTAETATETAWDATLVVDGTTGVKAQVTGEAATTIVWYGQVNYHTV
jgi:hypothetical protein